RLSGPLHVPRRHRQQRVGTDRGRAGHLSLSGQSDPAPSPRHALRRRVSPPLPPARPAARLCKGALLRDLESHLPSPTPSGASPSDGPAIGAHRIGPHHTYAATGQLGSRTDAMSTVSDWNLDPRRCHRSTTDARAMTVSSSNVLRPFPRPLTASFRRSPPRARLLLSLVRPHPTLPFTRGPPPIILGASWLPHNSRRDSSPHAHAR